MKTKAYQPERNRRHDLEVGALPDPGLELLGKANVSTYQLAKTIHAVAPDDEPELQRSEPAAQLDSPVAEVDDIRVSRRAEILGCHLKRTHQGILVSHEVRTTIEVDQKPLVRVEHKAVRPLHPIKQVPQLRNDGCRPGIR